MAEERKSGGAGREGQQSLSEFASARFLAQNGIPVARAMGGRDWDEIKRASATIGYPVVLKISSASVSHKTERGLVEIDLRNEAELELAFKKLKKVCQIDEPEYLVQEMVKGGRELMAGMVRDPQFGTCVMFGLGGTFAEIFGDVVFRPAPLSERDAAEMLQEIKAQKLLGSVRGMPEVNRDSLIQLLITLGRIGLEHEEISAIDINPLIIRGSEPVAVDALVVSA